MTRQAGPVLDGAMTGATLEAYFDRLWPLCRSLTGPGYRESLDILSEIMPKEFVYRRKQGFGAPIGTWLKQDAFRALVADTLEDNNAAVYNFLDPKVTKQLLVEFYQHDRKIHALQIWVLLCLELWYTTHKIAV